MERRKVHEVYDLESMPYLYKEDEDDGKERKLPEHKHIAKQEKAGKEEKQEGQREERSAEIRKSAPLPVIAEHHEHSEALEMRSRKTPPIPSIKNIGKEKRRGWAVAAVMILVIALIAAFHWNSNQPAALPTALAVVNGERIAAGEIDAVYEQARAQFPTVTKEQVLQQKIEEIVLLQEAQRKGIAADEAAVEQRMQQWAAQIRAALSEEQIAEQLKSQGTTFAELEQKNREIVRRQSIINTLLTQEVLDKRSVLVPERVMAAHILAANESEAKEILQELKAGANFSLLAAEKSIDPTAAFNQGELGYFGRGQMVKEFEDAAFAAEIGEIVGPVQTQFGFHVIRVEDIQREAWRFLSNLSREEQQLVATELQEALLQYVTQLRNTADIKITGLAPAAQPQQNLDAQLLMAKETFTDTSQPICRQGSKPIIRMFSAADCESCSWVAETFDAVMREQADAVVARRWELDTGDDKLSGQRETEIPAAELALFAQANPDRSVPTFIFGCRYVRIGNGYQEEKDLGKEKEEFRNLVLGMV